MKICFVIILIFICSVSQVSCNIPGSIEVRAESRWQSKEIPSDFHDVGAINTENKNPFLDCSGMTLETRVQLPEGYIRTPAEEGSFTEFLRNLPMKEADSPVLLYNGKEKGNQGAHIAVFALPIEKEMIQQGVNFITRIYAEYSKTSFTYSSTLILEEKSRRISLSDIQAGDVFFNAGTGHVTLVVDVCETEDGRKAFLLGQSSIPSQEFYLLKNPMHGEDPWYYEEEINYPFSTPECMFPEGSLRRLDN